MPTEASSQGIYICEIDWNGIMRKKNTFAQAAAKFLFRDVGILAGKTIQYEALILFK